MTATENLQLLHRVLTALRRADDHDTLILSPQEDGTITMGMICNDVFAWACSDIEVITLENIEVFEQAARDVIGVNPATAGRRGELGDINEWLNKANYQLSSDIGILFACHVRKQRPFKYKDAYPVHVSVFPLIDAITDKETDMDKPWKDLGVVPS